MRKAVLAELLLSLVMPRERAAATAGDLLESAQDTLAFCGAVLRTVRAAWNLLSWGSFAHALILGVALTVGMRFVFIGALTAGGRMVPGSAWLGPVFGVSYLLLSPALVGWLVARSMPGREMAAWLATFLFVVLEILTTPSVTQLPFTPVSLLPYLAGVVLARRTALQKGIA